MRIRKTIPSVGIVGSVTNTTNSSTTDTYSCDYINKNKDTYSTEEQLIGTWIDGKPLYRKVLSGAMPQVTTNGTAASSSINIPDNLDFVFCEFGFAKGYANNYNYVIPIVGIRYDAPSQYVTYNIYSRNIGLSSSRSDWNSFTAYFSLLYTKTTD